MTLKENPLTISIGFLICVALFIPLFIKVGIELYRSGR
jgi:hypothetical protein